MVNGESNNHVVMQCPECSGTGLYHGFMERRGEFVVCNRCKGTGKTELVFMPFEGRRECTDIKTVKLPDGTTITYDEFLRKY